MTTPQALRVTVAVATYHRPDDLRDLLPMLVAQVGEVSADGRYEASVLVVDNDADGSGRDVVTDLALAGVRAVVEPRPGISAARNRALSEATNADLVVFLDDDERPAPGWLANLLATWQSARPTAVIGPVESIFAEPPDPWVVAGEFFARRSRAHTRTGDDIDRGATNNLLLDVAQIRRFGLRFDEAFGISGGGDTQFTTSIVAAGGRLVWCREAVVTEVVPPERTTRRWLLTRALSYGTTDSRVLLSRATTRPARVATRLRCCAVGLPRMGVGAARTVVGLVLRSDRHHALGLQTFLRGLGLVAGAFGYTYQRYRRPQAPVRAPLDPVRDGSLR